MTEVMTEVRETGTKLLFDSDRQFERPTGDSVMRVLGEDRDGGQILDAVFVECSEHEAKLLTELLREIMEPRQETIDRVAQEVQALYASKLSGRDAAQIADIVARQWWHGPIGDTGVGTEREAITMLKHLAGRFERGAAYGETPPTPVSGRATNGGRD